MTNFFARLVTGAVALFAVFSFVLIPAAAPANGAGLIPDFTGKCPEDYRPDANGQYSITPIDQPCLEGERDPALDNIKDLISKVGNWFLGISGALVLFMFVLGGFYWILAAGNMKMVDQGKKFISSAVIGLVIMFTAYTLVTGVVRILGGPGVEPYIPKAQSPGQYNAGTGVAGQAKIYSAVKKEQICSKLGGTCSAQNTCGTPYGLSGVCGGAQDCCIAVKKAEQASVCGKVGGVCQSNSKPCSGTYVTGMCPGSATTQCCLQVSP